MNTFNKLATCTLMMLVLAASAFAQAPGPETTLANLTEGQGTISSSSNPQWDGYSELVLIPGASLMGASSTSTALYIGFTGGTEADIGNMVLYSTLRGNDAVIKATKVTLSGSSDPSIDLTSTSVCPNGAPTATNPCIIRLDTVKAALSTLDDYYFVVYFTLDTNNEKIAGVGQSVEPGALSGFYLYGDQTRIGAKGAIATNENTDQPAFFLAYVANE
jgi:hypothetical protein